jgi:hypothetical protein
LDKISRTIFASANGLILATRKDEAGVLGSNRGEFGAEEMLKIIPVRSPNKGRWFVILMKGKTKKYEHEAQQGNSSNRFIG